MSFMADSSPAHLRDQIPCPLLWEPKEGPWEWGYCPVLRSKMTQNPVSHTKGATKFKTNHRIKFPQNLKLMATARKELKGGPHNF